MECETCHGVLHQFRNNVAFHGRAEIAARIKAHQALSGGDTFLDLESARQDIHQLLIDLIAEELAAIPKLPERFTVFGISHHPAFTDVASAVP